MELLRTLSAFKMHHLLVWAVLFFGWHYFRYQDYPAKVAWWITTVKVADLALMIYVTNYLLIPQLLYKKKYVLFILVFIVFVTGFSILKMYVESELMFGKVNFDIWDRFKVRI